MLDTQHLRFSYLIKALFTLDCASLSLLLLQMAKLRIILFLPECDDTEQSYIHRLSVFPNQVQKNIWIDLRLDLGLIATQATTLITRPRFLGL